MILRRARREDVSAIVALMRDDELDSGRETPEGEALPASYYAAFDARDRDPSHELTVAEVEGWVIGTFQLMFLAHLGSRGALVAQIESVFTSTAPRADTGSARR